MCRDINKSAQLEMLKNVHSYLERTPDPTLTKEELKLMHTRLEKEIEEGEKKVEGEYGVDERQESMEALAFNEIPFLGAPASQSIEEYES